MSKIAILTDSSSDIPQALEQKYGIDILCFPMTLDGVSYTEREDFTYDEFYNMMRTAQGVPTTAAITTLRFLEKFCEYVDAGYTEVLAVLINSTGSATYNNAEIGRAHV